MLDKNLSILRKRFPQVLQRISMVQGDKSSQLFYDDSRPPKLLATKQKGNVPFMEQSKDQIISDWFGALRLKGESLYFYQGLDGVVRHFLENTSGGVFH